MVKSVLVTGSAGFIGKHVVRALVDKGYIVRKADRVTGMDLAEPWVVNALVEERPDIVVHLASSCSTLGSINRPLETFRDTVVTTAHVMAVAGQLSIPVIHTSSVKARDGLTPYGAAKRASEIWAEEIGRTYDIPVIVNRPGTVYGPGQQGSFESGWIAWFLRASKTGEEVTINGDGSQRRDLLHVSDYVRLILAQVKNPIRYAGQTWDIGGGERNAVSVLEMAHHLDLHYVFGPPRYGDAQEYLGTNAVPGWEPLVHWKEAEVFSGD